MSRTIDERVVSMQFDNKHFESNVRTSLSTLEKLKQSLNFKSASKGFDNLRAAAKNCTLQPLSNAVETVKIKFSAMEVMAVTALANITNSAVNTGKRMVRALTIDPIKTGLSEYETQINAIQTILANTESKGTTLDDVNAALDELNTYADKTIYNFTEMTRNIGTFTAAGIDLDTATNAIQGIANLAAVSGSNAQQASTAMYQLSQALASGTVKLMDWNSVVNAGMGGQVFQDALKETARVHGIKIDEMIKKEGSFRETLQNGWLTSEILTETLQKFTLTTEGLTEQQIEANRQMLKSKGYTDEQIESIFKLGETATNAATKVKTFTQLWDTLKEAAQSGWTQTWELIIGDFGEAKTLWTAVSDEIGAMIGKSADARNNLLEGALVSNWDKMVKKVNEAGVETTKFEEKLKESIKSHGIDVDKLIEKHGSLEDAFKSGAVSTDILKEAVKALEGTLVDLSDVESGLKMGSKGEDVKKVQKALKDLGYDLGKFGDGSGIDGIIGSVTTKAIKEFQKAQGLKVTGIIDDETLAALEKASGSVDGLYDSVKGLIGEVDKLGGRDLLIKSFANMWTALKKPLEAIKNAWRNIFPPATSEQLYNIIDGFHSLTEKLIMSDESAEKVGRVFEGLFAILKIGTTLVGGGFKLAFKGLSAVLEHFDLNLLDVAAAAGDALVKFRDWAFESGAIAKAFDKVTGFIAKGIVKVRDWIKAFVKLPIVQQNVDRIKEAFVDTFDKLKGSLGGALKIVGEFFGKFKSLDSFSISNIVSLFSEFKTKIIDYFSNIDNPFEKIGTALKNFKDDVKTYLEQAGVKFDEIGEKISNFVKMVKEKLGDNMGSIIAIGVLLVFLLLVKKIKEAIESIAKPFDMVGDFLDNLGSTLKSFGQAAKANALKNIAVSIAILAGSVLLLALLPQAKVWSSVGAIVALGGALVGMSFLLSKFKPGDFGKLSLSILGLAGSMLIMALAAKMIGGMDGKALLKGGLAMAAFLTMIVIVSKSTKGMSIWVGEFGKMMLKLSGALLIFALVTKILGSMKTETLIKGGLAIATFLGMMVGMMAATKLLDGSGDTIKSFGKAMVSLGAALLLMSLSVKILGSMDTKTLVKGGAAVTVFLGLMAGMMYTTKFLKKDIKDFGKTMLALSASLLLMSAAVSILGNMDTDTLIKGGVAVGVFLGMMIGVMASMRLITKNAKNAGKVGLMMLGFSTAILMLAGSVMLLGMLDSGKLKQGIIAVGAISVILAGLVIATKYAKSIKTGTIIGLSVAIGILAISVAALTFIDPKKLAGATAALSVITGMFALLAFTSKFVTWKAMTALAGMILLVGGIALVLHKLTSNTKDADSALKGAIAISVIITALSASCALLAAASKFGPKTVKGLGIMAGVLGIVSIFAGIAIWQLPNIGKQLSKFMENMKPFLDGAKDIKPESMQGLKTLGQAMLLFSGAGGIFAIVDTLTLGGVTRAFASFVNFIKEVTPVVRDLALSVSGEGVDINTSNLEAVIDAVSGLAEAANNVPTTTIIGGFGKFQGGFGLALGASIPMMSSFAKWLKEIIPVIKEFAFDVSDDDVNIDGDAIASICEAVVTLAEAANDAPKLDIVAGGGGGKGIGAGFLAISIPQLQKFAIWLNNAAAIMSEFSIKISESDITSDDADNITSICEGVKVLAEAAGEAPVISGAIGGGGGKGLGAGFLAISIPQLKSFSDWLKEVIPIMSGFTSDIEESQITKDDASTLNSICEGVKVLAEAAGEAPDLVIAGGGGGGKGLGAGFLAISIPQLQKFTTWLSNVIPIMSGFTANIEESQITKDDATTLTSICEGVKVLAEAAGEAPTINGAVGGGGGAGFGGGFVAISVPQLQKFTTWLQEVTPIMTGFTATLSESKIKASDASTLTSICEGVKALGEAAANAPGVDVGVAFANIGPVIAGGAYVGVDDLKSFKEWIEEVGPIMSDFSVDVKEAKITEDDASAIKSICDAVNILGEAANAGSTGTEITGGVAAVGPAIAAFVSVKTDDLSSFKTWLEGVVPVMSGIATSLTEVEFTEEDGSKVKKICEAVRTLGEAASFAPTKEEYKSWFSEKTTETDLGAFKTWLDTVITTINDIGVKLAESDTNIDTARLTAIANSAKALSEGMNAFCTGLNIQWFDPEAFNLVITGIADGMVDFSKKVAEIDDASVNAAAGSAKNIADVFTIMAPYGGDYSSVDTTAFKNKAIELGDGMKEFASSMDGVDVSSGVSQIKSLVDTVTKMSNGDFSGVDGFISAINNLSTVSLDEVVTAFSDADKISSVGVSLIENLTSGITSDPSKISTAISNVVSTAIDSVKSAVEAFKEVGTTAMSNFGMGMSENTSKIITLSTAMGMQAAVAASTSYSSFYNAGGYVAEGFANGISANTFMAIAKAKAMAQKAYEAAKEALNVNSPSKLFRSLGYSVPEGFALGIDKLGGMVKDSAVGMADTAIAGTKNAIGRIADAVNSDIDAQPTIRPVIDLSEVTAGASAINGMLGMKPSVRVLANVNAISASMNGRQNGVNKDVVSAIDDLGRKLGKTTGDTYNINGVTYDDGSNITDAVKTLIRAARVERRS